MLDKNFNFKDFAFECSRAFGALVSMRDDPMGTPIPQSLPEDTYHKKAYAKAVKILAEWKKLSKKEKEKKIKAQISRSISSTKNQMKKNESGNIKIRAMIKEAQKWNPPTPEHVGLKNFMIKQLFNSLENNDYYEKKINELDNMNLKTHIAEYEKSLRYSIV